MPAPTVADAPEAAETDDADVVERALEAAEAPREYLARVLSERGLPQQPLTTITTLFEEARLSPHPVHTSAPGHTLSELEEVRAALAGRQRPQQASARCPRQESNLEPSD